MAKTQQTENLQSNKVAKQYPASNVARFDGLHRDQVSPADQTMDAAQIDLKGKDHKYREES